MKTADQNYNGTTTNLDPIEEAKEEKGGGFSVQDSVKCLTETP